MDEILAKKKTIERRNAIGWAVFFVLLVLSYNEYISYIFLLMLSFPLLAFIVWINSITDNSIENNKIRLTLLAFVLIASSSACYYGKYEDNKKTDIALDYCYKNIKDTSKCDELNFILNSK